jgi:hypothetical protein
VERVALGFCPRTGSAVVVAIQETPDGVTLTGRWTVDLTDGLVAPQVFHAVAGWADRAAALRRVEETIDVVRSVAARRLEELLTDLPRVVAVGVVTGEQRRTVSVAAALDSHPRMHAAEGELYREALLDAATNRGLAVTAMPRRLADERLSSGGPVAQAVGLLGATVRPPWRKEHKRAAAAALAALTISAPQETRR